MNRAALQPLTVDARGYVMRGGTTYGRILGLTFTRRAPFSRALLAGRVLSLDSDLVALLERLGVDEIMFTDLESRRVYALSLSEFRALAFPYGANPPRLGVPLACWRVV